MVFDSQFHKMHKKIFTPLNSTCNFGHNLPIRFDIVCIKPSYLLGHYLTGAINPLDPVKIKL